MSKPIRILHIVRDDVKFFNTVISCFESEERFANICALIVNDENEAFKSIPSTDKITVLSSRRQVSDFLKRDSYDCVFFHSLQPKQWYVVKCIPSTKPIIWWAWGFDIYEQFPETSPLINIPLYKPITAKLYASKYTIKKQIKDFLKKFTHLYYNREKQYILSRISYFQPVIFNDYKSLIEQYKSFNAKEFYYPHSLGDITPIVGELKNPDGNILFGNSATLTNNHLDVWDAISDYIGEHQKIITPVSYGDMKYASLLKEKISDARMNYLDKLLDRKEYFKVVDSCTYYVSGVLRQQSMGNIFYCLRNGIKVFLFKDSEVFKYLKKIGVIVFAIEEIYENSFTTPLSYEETENNLKALKAEELYRKSKMESFISSF